MDLTPRDIQQKQFHDTFRGYSHEEVDLFLDEVAEAFDKVFRENQSFHHRLTELEGSLTEARGSEDMLKRMLVTAQETADKAVQEARERASNMVSTSQAKSEEILTGAERSAGEIVSQASDRAKKIVEDAINKERELQVRIEALKHFEAEYRARIKAFIESQLDAVDKGAELPALPGEPVPAARISEPPASSPAPKPADDPKVLVPPLTPDVKAEPISQQPAAVVPQPTAPAVSTEERESMQRVTVGPEPDAQGAKVAAGNVAGESEASDVPDQDRSIRELFWGEE